MFFVLWVDKGFLRISRNKKSETPKPTQTLYLSLWEKKIPAVELCDIWWHVVKNVQRPERFWVTHNLLHREKKNLLSTNQGRSEKRRGWIGGASVKEKTCSFRGLPSKLGATSWFSTVHCTVGDVDSLFKTEPFLYSSGWTWTSTISSDSKYTLLYPANTDF